MKFKLKDGIENPIEVNYTERHGAGNVYTHKTFYPGKVYGFPGDDEVAKQTLLAFQTKVRKTDEIIELFDRYGIEYTFRKPTCPCQKVPFVVFNPIIEVD